MNEASIPKGPFFANALHCGSEESEIGLYFFIPDLLLIPIETWDVRKHEVAHRVFAHDGTSGSDWLATRRLVGISHALCMQIFTLAGENDLFIHGKRLGELRVSGKSSVRTTVETLLSRLKENERVIDIVWSSLVPVAEIAAIDFSENLDPRDPSWYVWRSTSLSADEREKLDEQKARLVQAAVAGYPPDFRGYHLTHGSFQEAVRQAWEAYNKIEDDGARKELLRLAMSSLAPVDNQAQFQIIDPIRLILDNATFAQQQAEEARGAFFVERLSRSQAVFAWLDYISTFAFSGIEHKSIVEDPIREAWSTVDLVQEVWKKIEDESVQLGIPIMTVGMYDVVEGGAGPWFGLLRFVWNVEGGGVAIINHVFLDVLGKMASSDSALPINYILRLLFREQLRMALKTGQPIVCPFKGYKISSTHRGEALKCNVNCLMRELIESVRHWSKLASDDALCEISIEAHEKSGVQGRQAKSTKVADTVIEAHKETPQMTRGEPHCCSFCGKGQDKVRKLIAGPRVFICNECVKLCLDILREEGL